MRFKFTFACLLFLSALSTAHARTPLKVIAKDAFIYVKVTKEMFGGNIEVRDSTGTVISTKNIDHRKMYLDLFELSDGKYDVTIQHDDVVLKFLYTVDSPGVHAKRKHHQSDDGKRDHV